MKALISVFMVLAMTSVSFAQGALFDDANNKVMVWGTQQGDTIVVYGTEDNMTVNINGVVHGPFVGNDMAVEIHGGSGNDTIGYGDLDNKPAADHPKFIVYAGDGWDIVITGHNNDFLSLGEGNDVSYTHGGFDTTWCGNGDDTHFSGDGTDMSDGGPGIDSLDQGGANDYQKLSFNSISNPNQ